MHSQTPAALEPVSAPPPGRAAEATTESGSADGSPRRVVMFVFNDCTKDARVLREAASLHAAGWDTWIIARPRDLKDERTEVEDREGVRIVRVPIPSTWRGWFSALRNPIAARYWLVAETKRCLRAGPVGWARLAGVFVLSLIGLPVLAMRVLIRTIRSALHRPARPGGSTIDWLRRWQFSTMGWARNAAAAAPPATVYHGHDMTGLPAARMAWQANGGQLVYDSHEIFFSSGGNANRPRWARSLFERTERRWARDAAALVTVNQSLADVLAPRFAARRTVVLYNTPSRWTPPESPVDPLRPAAGIASGTPVALYHGSFAAHRGIEELAEAILLPGMEGVHGVLLGYGALLATLRTLATEARFGGRLHVLDAVPPEILAEWVAAADVEVLPIRRSTLNHYLSSPNKLFEALNVGVPVVASDFPEMHRIVMDGPWSPLGALCDPDDPASIAGAIRGVLELGPQDRVALRERCLAAADGRWNWETEVQGLLGLYGDLAGQEAIPAIHGFAKKLRSSVLPEVLSATAGLAPSARDV